MTVDSLVVVCLMFWWIIIALAIVLVMMNEYTKHMVIWYIPYTLIIGLLYSWYLISLV
jgi:hypothetical protein